MCWVSIIHSSNSLLRNLVIAGGLLCLPAFLWAQESADQLLLKLLKAETTQGYSGVFVYSNGAGLRTMQVDKTIAGEVIAERVISSDGRVLDNRRDIGARYRVDPASKRILVFPAAGKIDEAELAARLSNHYEIAAGDYDRVAGKLCRQLSLLPRDESRYGSIYCVEPRTGVVLKSRTLTPEGVTLEQMVFTRVSLTDPGGMEPELAELELAGFRRVPGVLLEQRPEWTADWVINAVPDGFAIRALQEEAFAGPVFR